MTTNHTPGPWTATGKLGLLVAKEFDDGRRLAVADTWSAENARLIAAAPELLAFAARVEDVLEYYNENKGVTRDNALCELYELARAAIAKATGAA